MTTRRIAVLSLALALVALAATATAGRSLGRLRAWDLPQRPEGGADSTRVAKFLDALGTGDPLVCAVVASQIGNYWSDEGRDGVGRFSDAMPSLDAARDSLQETVTEPQALRLLEARLDDANSCVRRVAARLLQGSSVETDRLVGLLESRSSRVREAAAYALADEDRRAARTALERIVESGRAPEVAMAAWALGEQGDVQAVPTLSRALERGDARTQYAAAHALGELDDLEVAPPQLVRAARSGDATLQRYAGDALAEIEDPATVDIIIELVSATDARTRRRAIEALGSIGSPKAIPALTAATRDADPDVRRAAVEALGEVAKDR